MRLFKALGALTALLAVVIGPPLLLVTFIGNPWPAEGVSLSAPLTDSALIGLLAVIVWVLWAQLVGCIVVEAVAALSGDRVQLPAGFALGIQQQLARRLVTAVVVAVVPAGAILGGGAGAAVAATPVSSPAVSAPVVVTGVQGDVDAGVKADRVDKVEVAAAHPETVPVVRLDTLWGIADRVLGDGDRWPEIATLNEGQEMNDGAVFSSADQIRPGWELHVPADAKIGADQTDKAAGEVVEHQVVVKPGDTLSEIALEEMGDPNAYPSIFEASKATDQPDGARLVDPNMIDVGWTVTIPGAEAAPQSDNQSDEQVDQQPATPDAGAPAELEEGSGARGGDVPPTLNAAPLEELPQVEEAPEAVEPEAAPAAPETPAPSTEQSEQSEPSGQQEQSADQAPVVAGDEVDEEEAGWPVQTISGVCVLLAAGFVGLLTRRRNRQRRERKPGQRMPLPTPAAEAVELEVRTVANEITLDQVDVALRHLAENAPDGSVPTVRLARLSGDQLEVYLQEPVTMPTPWEDSSDGAVWMLPAGTLADLEVQAAAAAPYPAMVTVGTDAEGGVLMVNLEHSGGLQAAGASGIARHVVTAAAVELAVSPWAAGVSVTVVGDLDELAELIDQDRPGAMRYVPLLEDAGEIGDLDDARVRVVIDTTGSATTSTQRQELRASGTAVLAPGVDEPGAWTLEMYDSDRAMLVDLGLNVTPQLVDEATYDGLMEILRTSLAQPFAPARRSDTPTILQPPVVDQHVVDQESVDHVLIAAGEEDLDRSDAGQGTYQPEPPGEQLDAPRPPVDHGPGSLAVAVDDRVTTHETTQESVDAGVLAAIDHQLADDLADLAPDTGTGTATGTDAVLEDAVGDLPSADVDEDLVDQADHHVEQVEQLGQADVEVDGGTSLDELQQETAEEQEQVAVVTPVPVASVSEENAAKAGWEPDVPVDQVHPLLQTGHPVVRLLGSTVDIIGTGAKAPASKSHLEKCTAIAAWLVLNPDRSRAELVDAVWGTGRRVSANTIDPRISNLRNWLGVNPETEQKYFPTRTLRLEAPVTSDWHLFTQLVGPSPERASTTALESALGLVRDTPFKGESSQQYGFAEYVLTDMVDTIADAAYDLARRRYMDSSWRKAERAARVGVIVDPSNERLWRIRIHAAHAAGRPEDVEEFIDRMHARISELGFYLEPETTDLIEAVRRHDSVSVAEQARAAL